VISLSNYDFTKDIIWLQNLNWYFFFLGGGVLLLLAKEWDPYRETLCGKVRQKRIGVFTHLTNSTHNKPWWFPLQTVSLQKHFSYFEYFITNQTNCHFTQCLDAGQQKKYCHMSCFSMINGCRYIFSQDFEKKNIQIVNLKKTNAALASFLFTLWSILLW
jgi:hypothetical protein